MQQKIGQMYKIRQKNKVYFNRNSYDMIQCEYCFSWQQDFNTYRFNHIRTCSAKSVYTQWIPSLKDIEIELYGEYRNQPNMEKTTAYGICDYSNVDTDGDDGMSDKTGQQQQQQQVTFTRPTTTEPSTSTTTCTPGANDFNYDNEDEHQHHDQLMIERAIYQNITDNTPEGKTRMVQKARNKDKRQMDDNDTDSDANMQSKKQMNDDMNDKLEKFKQIVDYTLVPGLDETVTKFITIS